MGLGWNQSLLSLWGRGKPCRVHVGGSCIPGCSACPACPESRPDCGKLLQKEGRCVLRQQALSGPRSLKLGGCLGCECRVSGRTPPGQPSPSVQPSATTWLCLGVLGGPWGRRLEVCRHLNFVFNITPFL